MSNSNMNCGSETQRRGPILAEFTGPGPAYCPDYKPLKTKAPSYSFGLRTVLNGSNKTPSPGKYFYSGNLTHLGLSTTPAYSIGERNLNNDKARKSQEIGPAPGAYTTEKAKNGILSTELKSPSYSMRWKTKDVFKNESPPSNSYNLIRDLSKTSAVYKNSPSASIKSKSEFGTPQYQSIRAGIPGPASYESIDLNRIRKCDGAYTLKGRNYGKVYSSLKDNPGPGSYYPKSSLEKKNGGFSMGIKPSPYSLLVLTTRDLPEVD